MRKLEGGHTRGGLKQAGKLQQIVDCWARGQARCWPPSNRPDGSGRQLRRGQQRCCTGGLNAKQGDAMPPAHIAAGSVVGGNFPPPGCLRPGPIAPAYLLHIGTGMRQPEEGERAEGQVIASAGHHGGRPASRAGVHCSGVHIEQMGFIAQGLKTMGKALRE
ncbi:hypothetical protein FQR65_LT20808 [Abscondita terminalis]|nr:hypothetical protein FQR65_LT20808 [Abscondita terminalis]